MNKIYPYLLAVLSLFSCSTEFDSYTKTGDNDLEKNDLRGPVKTISIYNIDGILLNVVTYNKWGFFAEKLNYSKGVFQDGALQSVKHFEYDEFGNVLKKTECNEVNNMTTILSYVYDSHHNLLTEWLQTKTEINTLSTKEVSKLSGKTIQAIHEYDYDKNHAILKETIHDKRNAGHAKSKVCMFDDKGNVVESYYINAEGEKEGFRKYEYDAHGNKICYTQRDREGHLVDSTKYTYTATPVNGAYRKTSIAVYYTPYSINPNRDSKVTYTYNALGDVERQIIERYNEDGSLYNRRVFNIRYTYDEENNWTSKEILLEANDGSQEGTLVEDTIGYRRVIEYY